MKTSRITATIAALSIATFGMIPFASASNSIQAKTQAIIAQNPGLNAHVVTRALQGYTWAYNHGEVGKNNHTLTIVNFSEPSNKKRLHVINLNTDKVEMTMLVAQGHNTGLLYAKHFSNQPGTHESSLGVYATSNTYIGEHGYSMRVNGLEAGINNNARSRAIVMHPAWYATPQFNKKYGRLGRSWGCFAVDPKKSTKLINTIKGGSVLFAYAASENHDANIDSITTFA